MTNETELTPPAPGQMIDVGAARVALLDDGEYVDAFHCFRPAPTGDGEEMRRVLVTATWDDVVAWLRTNGDLP